MIETHTKIFLRSSADPLVPYIVTSCVLSDVSCSSPLRPRLRYCLLFKQVVYRNTIQVKLLRRVNANPDAALKMIGAGPREDVMRKNAFANVQDAHGTGRYVGLSTTTRPL